MPQPTFRVRGIRKLLRKLRAFEEKGARRAIRRALRRATEEVRQTAEELAPFDTGQLEESIVVSLLTRDQRRGIRQAGVKPFLGINAFRVGPSRVDGFYGLFQELGREPGVGPSGRPYPGHDPQPFMGPALEISEGKAIRIFVRELRAEINKLAASR